MMNAPCRAFSFIQMVQLGLTNWISCMMRVIWEMRVAVARVRMIIIENNKVAAYYIQILCTK